VSKVGSQPRIAVQNLRFIDDPDLTLELAERGRCAAVKKPRSTAADVLLRTKACP
jgi:hypothetical protein